MPTVARLAKPPAAEGLLLLKKKKRVSALLDALIIEISSGKVNIHVLMAMVAVASVFMGNSLEGRLLLAMFNFVHIAEEKFTGQWMVDVNELKENYPEFALVLDTSNDKLPKIPVMISCLIHLNWHTLAM